MKQALTARQQEALDFITLCLGERGFPPTLREIGQHMGIRSTNGVNDHLKALERKGYLVREELKSRALRPVDYVPEANASTAHDVTAASAAGRRGESGSGRVPTSPHSAVATGLSGAPPTVVQSAERPVENGGEPDPSMVLGAGMGGFGPPSQPVQSTPAGMLMGHPENAGFDVPILGRVAAGEPILAEQNVVDRVKVDRFFLGAVQQSEVFGLVIQGESMVEDGIHDGDYIFVRKQPTALQGEIVVVMIDGEATCKRFFVEGDRIRLQPANHTMKPIYVHESEFRQIGILGKVVGVYRRL